MAPRSALLLCLLLLAPSAQAESLYTGQVAVASQSEADTAAALAAALGQVLARLTGDNAVLNRPGVAKAVAQPNRYVQQYRYAQDVVTDSGQPQVRLNLVAQFDHAAIDKLLADLGLTRGAAVTSADSGPAAPAAADTSAQTFRVWISGVNSAIDYARAMGTLTRNELVRNVQIEQARNDGMQLRVEVNGPLQRLLDSFANGPLRVLNAAPPVEGMDALLGLAQ